jgi:hypothetical protein
MSTTPDPKEIVLDTKRLIESGQFKRIEGVLRDAACGRCYLGLVTETLIEKGLCYWRKTDTNWIDLEDCPDYEELQSQQMNNIITEDCEYVLEITEKGKAAGLLIGHFQTLDFDAIGVPTTVVVKPEDPDQPELYEKVFSLNDSGYADQYGDRKKVTWSDINDLQMKVLSKRAKTNV